MYNIVLKNAKVIDGTGNAWYKADIGIKNDKIKKIGVIKESDAEKVIDVTGYTVTPGFIDYHGHSDYDIFAHPSAWNKLEQGITTEVAGHCGISLAPISKQAYEGFVRGAAFVFSDEITKEKCKEFTTFKKYMNEVDKTEIGINLAVYVGHCTVRGSVMGYENRKPTDREMEIMKSMVQEAMESGAVGLSTGLVYPPSIYADVDELVELSRVVAEYGGSYVSHIRSASYRVEEAIEEAIEIGRRSGASVIVSHHKVSGKENWGKAQKTLDLIEAANDAGVEVGLDQYPYIYGATTLAQTIHPKYKTRGLEELVNMLKDSKKRAEIKNCILTDKLSWENFYINCGFEGMLITHSKNVPDANGKTIAEYAQENDMDDFDALFDLLIKDGCNTNAAFLMMCDSDVEMIMKYDKTMIGTDGAVIKPNRIEHPRYIGAYPRLLGRYVREKKVLKLEDAIRKMTSLPAIKAKLKSKGLIKEGFDADLVVFDEKNIIDNADYINYKEKNEGMKYVFVNGQIAVEDNVYNGTLNGKLLKSRG